MVSIIPPWYPSIYAYKNPIGCIIQREDGIDAWGGDLWDEVVSTREECERICAKSDACKRYVFGGTATTGNCYMKTENFTRLRFTTGHKKAISGLLNSRNRFCNSNG